VWIIHLGPPATDALERRFLELTSDAGDAAPPTDPDLVEAVR